MPKHAIKASLKILEAVPLKLFIRCFGEHCFGGCSTRFLNRSKWPAIVIVNVPVSDDQKVSIDFSGLSNLSSKYAHSIAHETLNYIRPSRRWNPRALVSRLYDPHPTASYTKSRVGHHHPLQTLPGLIPLGHSALQVHQGLRPTRLPFSPIC